MILLFPIWRQIELIKYAAFWLAHAPAVAVLSVRMSINRWHPFFAVDCQENGFLFFLQFLPATIFCCVAADVLPSLLHADIEVVTNLSSVLAPTT